MKWCGAEAMGTRRHSVFMAELLSYTLVFIGLGVLAWGLHDSLRGMTEHDCDQGVAAACRSLGR